MKLDTKKVIDYYLGGILMVILKPLVWSLGYILKRDHTPWVNGTICFVKMLGGGSLVIAYPALLGLRRQYPDATFSLITTKGIKPFAETLGIFDRIDEIDDSTIFQLCKSGLLALYKNFWVDTLVDFEVYSRLTAILSTLTGARNRIGFYLEAVFWRKRLHTHLIFFNRFSGSFLWYDAIAYLLGAEPASNDLCLSWMKQKLGLIEEKPTAVRRIAIGHACSDLAGERMLNEKQWLAVFEQNLTPTHQAEIVFLGAAADRDFATRIIDVVNPRFPQLSFQNSCGEMRLSDSIRLMATCKEFWGIDSALLHYARLMKLKCVSCWGPTDPATRLRPIPDLVETVQYRKAPCSPCVHVAEEPPCQRNNICIQGLFNPTIDYSSVSWLAYSSSAIALTEGDGTYMIRGLTFSEEST